MMRAGGGDILAPILALKCKFFERKTKIADVNYIKKKTRGSLMKENGDRVQKEIKTVWQIESRTKEWSF